MTQPIIVHKNRTEVISLALGFDVSDDTFSSEIRVDKDRTSELIATWEITFFTDGTDGELVLTLDDSVTSNIEKSIGYMDLKRVTGGKSVSGFDDILEVLFIETITE